jgi:hypothetical protein
MLLIQAWCDQPPDARREVYIFTQRRKERKGRKNLNNIPFDPLRE